MLIRADGPHPPCQALSSALLAEAPALPSSGHQHAERGCSPASRQHPLQPGFAPLPWTRGASQHPKAAVLPLQPSPCPERSLPVRPFGGVVCAEDQASCRVRR